MSIYTQTELEEMLADVKAAIKKCLTAQSYNAGSGMAVTRADLLTLQKREAWLLSELAQCQTAGNVNLAQFQVPR